MCLLVYEVSNCAYDNKYSNEVEVLQKRHFGAIPDDTEDVVTIDAVAGSEDDFS